MKIEIKDGMKQVHNKQVKKFSSPIAMHPNKEEELKNYQ